MPQQPIYLDENGNPIKPTGPVYLDENGNPIPAPAGAAPGWTVGGIATKTAKQILSPIPALERGAASLADKIDVTPRPSAPIGEFELPSSGSDVLELLKGLVTGPFTQTAEAAAAVPGYLEAQVVGPSRELLRGNFREAAEQSHAAARGMGAGVVEGLGRMSPLEILGTLFGGRRLAKGPRKRVPKVDTPETPPGQPPPPRLSTSKTTPATPSDMYGGVLSKEMDRILREIIDEEGATKHVELPPSEPPPFPKTGSRGPQVPPSAPGGARPGGPAGPVPPDRPAIPSPGGNLRHAEESVEESVKNARQAQARAMEEASDAAEREALAKRARSNNPEAVAAASQATNDLRSEIRKLEAEEAAARRQQDIKVLNEESDRILAEIKRKAGRKVKKDLGQPPAAPVTGPKGGRAIIDSEGNPVVSPVTGEVLEATPARVEPRPTGRPAATSSTVAPAAPVKKFDAQGRPVAAATATSAPGPRPGWQDRMNKLSERQEALAREMEADRPRTEPQPIPPEAIAQAEKEVLEAASGPTGRAAKDVAEGRVVPGAAGTAAPAVSETRYGELLNKLGGTAREAAPVAPTDVSVSPRGGGYRGFKRSIAEERKRIAESRRAVRDVSVTPRSLADFAKEYKIGPPPTGVPPDLWARINLVEREAVRLYAEHKVVDPRLIDEMRRFWGAQATAERLRVIDMTPERVRDMTPGLSRSPLVKAMADNEARYRHLLDDPRGFIRTEALVAGSGAAAGGLVGMAVGGENIEDRAATAISMALIGGAGAWGGTRALVKAIRNRKPILDAVETADTTNLLFGPAIVKTSLGAFMGVVSGIWQRMREGRWAEAKRGIQFMGREGPKLYLKTLFGPTANLKRSMTPYVQNAAHRAGFIPKKGGKFSKGVEWVAAQGLRPFIASDRAGSAALRRMGFSDAEASRLLLIGEPTTWQGQALLSIINSTFAGRMLSKFPRVRIGGVERAFEFTPGAHRLNTRVTSRGQLTGIGQRWSRGFIPQEGLSKRARRARAEFGAGVLLGGTAYGYFADPSLAASGMVASAAGPAFVPAVMGIAGGKALRNNDPSLAATRMLEALVAQVPQFSEADVRRIGQRFDLGRPMRRFLGVDEEE